MTGTPDTTSGDGTRPSTAGGVDNLGAAKGFTPGKAEPGSQAPAPPEKMQEKKQDRGSDNAGDPGPSDT